MSTGLLGALGGSGYSSDSLLQALANASENLGANVVGGDIPLEETPVRVVKKDL